MMRKLLTEKTGLILLVAAAVMLLGAGPAAAKIDGITGTSFDFTAKTAHISTADGFAPLLWGFANGSGEAQYPGPTLILAEDVQVTITLTNELPEAVSMVFPGQEGVVTAEVAPPTEAGQLTREARPGGVVSYTFTPTEPGTYMYRSGTNMDKQIEMGLFGAIIVRPAGFNPASPTAYNHPDSAYDREILFLLSEMDLNIHQLVEFGEPSDPTTFFPVYWFINGRNAPDTMASAGSPLLPNQPYNCMPRIHPGERLLCRYVGGGRDLHPFHQHGNNFDVIARDGRLLSSDPGVTGADLSMSVFTLGVAPGTTWDSIFTWTGEGLNFDIYGTEPHDLQPAEDPADHLKPLPVSIPPLDDLTVGDFYSGSPFLGASGQVPPGAGALNQTGYYSFMWHSHNEKEMVNNDIFPGGLMTMCIVEAPWVTINE
jgi:FtsP/CotA-like multicopper oxidase with cupredoxin domain